MLDPDEVARTVVRHNGAKKSLSQRSGGLEGSIRLLAKAVTDHLAGTDVATSITGGELLKEQNGDYAYRIRATYGSVSEFVVTVTVRNDSVDLSFSWYERDDAMFGALRETVRAIIQEICGALSAAVIEVAGKP